MERKELFWQPRNTGKPEPVNLGSGMEISIHDLARLICNLVDFQREIRCDKTNLDDQLRHRVNSSKAEKRNSVLRRKQAFLVDFEIIIQ